MEKINILTQKDFDWVKWNEKKIKEEVKNIIQKTDEEILKIKNIKKEDRTFENTIFALEKKEEGVGSVFSRLHALSQLSPQKNIREITQRFEVFLSEKMIEFDSDKDIFDAICEYKKNNFKKENLSEVDKVLLREYFYAYKKKGFSLPEKKQQELKKINKKISKLSSKFSVNLNNYSDKILLSKSETKGLSEIFLNSLKKEKGKYIVTLDYPEIVPFLETSANSKKRREIFQKNSRKGGRGNLKILNEILELKKTKTKILGYQNYPDYVVEDRMAKKGENVEKFFESLIEKVKNSSLDDLRNLERFKIKKEYKKKKLESYDVSYYSNLLKKAKFNVDENHLKEFFQLENVKKEMFETFSNLFGFKIKKNNSVKLWHKDVEFYDIFVGEKKISHLIFDLYPREGKYGHACMMELSTHSKKYFDKNKKEYNPSCATIVCNFLKPTKNIPSLISHYEIQTIFHEFGHALHHVLTQAKYINNSGTNVAWDFVEVPSQLLENWCWDEKFLYKVSHHWKTGEKLDKEKIKNLISSRNFLNAYGNLRQLLMTKFDYDLHQKKIKIPEIYWQKLSKRYFMPTCEKSLFPASFGHIVNGYDSGYYSYLWALVYADDIFSEFERKGIYSKSVGKKYRKEILEMGSERGEKKSVEIFLGRKSNSKAFLKNLAK